MGGVVDRGVHRGRVRCERKVGVRRHAVYVMLTDEERGVLETQARLRGVSLSRAARDAIIQPVQIEAEGGREELEYLVSVLGSMANDLTGIARNFNQITRYAHTIRDLPKEYEEAVARVHSLLVRMGDALGEVKR